MNIERSLSAFFAAPFRHTPQSQFFTELFGINPFSVATDGPSGSQIKENILFLPQDRYSYEKPTRVLAVSSALNTIGCSKFYGNDSRSDHLISWNNVIHIFCGSQMPFKISGTGKYRKYPTCHA